MFIVSIYCCCYELLLLVILICQCVLLLIFNIVSNHFWVMSIFFRYLFYYVQFPFLVFCVQAYIILFIYHIVIRGMFVFSGMVSNLYFNVGVMIFNVRCNLQDRSKHVYVCVCVCVCVRVHAWLLACMWVWVRVCACLIIIAIIMIIFVPINHSIASYN